MPSCPELYPPRERSTNVALIQGLIAARGDAAIEEAIAEAALSLHPSLFAELDWMELTVPAAQQARAADMVDRVFIELLPAVLTQRHVEFAVTDAELAAEVHGHALFYEWARQRPAIVGSWGTEYAGRITHVLSDRTPDPTELQRRCLAAARPRIEALVHSMDDRGWIAALVDVELRNAIVCSLDHASSRLDAKAFLRASGGHFPEAYLDDLERAPNFDRTVAQLRELADRAVQASLFDFSAVCVALAEALEAIDPGSLTGYGGELMSGYGNCGRCSMMYASSAVVSLDPTCPGIFQGEDGTITLSLELNVTTCMFCRRRTRVESPAMFYSPARNQVVYNVPALGQFSEAEAVEAHRQTIAAIRQRYMARLDARARLSFEAANEDITFRMVDFIRAIHMGTTANEEHAFVLGRSCVDGSGIIIDRTKGVIISVTPDEMRELFDPYEMPPGPSQYDRGTRPNLSDAITAFGEKDYVKARALLEELYIAFPDDPTLRKNLAAAYITLGDKGAARRLFRNAPE